MGRFRDKVTGVECIVVLVYLARGDVAMRFQQAKALRLRAEDQTVPVVGIGDFNFDFDFPTQKGNAAFDEFLQGGVWQCAEPENLVDTNWADHDGDG